MVEPKQKIDVIKEDPSDNKFVEAAIAGKAEYIITQDKNILKVKEYMGIKMVTPKEFLELTQ